MFGLMMFRSFKTGVVTRNIPRKAGQAAMNSPEIDIRIAMGAGSGYCRVMTCDLTNEYVRINAEYRT